MPQYTRKAQQTTRDGRGIRTRDVVFCRFPAGLANRVQHYAAKRGISVNRWVIEACQAFADASRGDVTPAIVVKDAAWWFGKIQELKKLPPVDAMAQLKALTADVAIPKEFFRPNSDLALAEWLSVNVSEDAGVPIPGAQTTQDASQTKEKGQVA